MSSVQFENQQSPDELVIRPPKPRTLGDTLMRLRLVKNSAEAMLLIALLASFLISASIYLLVSSVPADSPRAGPPAESGTSN